MWIFKCASTFMRSMPEREMKMRSMAVAACVFAEKCVGKSWVISVGEARNWRQRACSRWY
eukprot:3327982-Pyramimonas_sp.AAC.1